MPRQLTLREVLEGAIQKEIMSRFLYIGLRQRVTNQASRDAFQSLAEQEEVHQTILQDYLKGQYKEGSLGLEMVVDYKITEYLNEPEISPSIKMKDIFFLAAEREKSAHELFNYLAVIHPAGQMKKFLEEFAYQELEHKHRLENLYIEDALPQTDGR
jgi:rubrerythrin